MTSYSQQLDWQRLQAFLPVNYRLTADQLPTEEWWGWQGHQIHLDTYRNPQAPIKVILLHGVGTNGRQMSMILGAPLAKRGYEVIAIDMPSYGLTQVAEETVVTYEDWVAAGCALIDAEQAKDPRPIVLYGLSAGGMLTYHIACQRPIVRAIVGMTFLEMSNPDVRDASSSSPFISRLGSMLMPWLVRTPLANLRIPMRWVSKMRALVNHPDALKIFLNDRSSAGNAVTLAFLQSYLSYMPTIAPENFDVCPILLTQPADDRWTPLALSEPFLAKIAHTPVSVVLLERAGHYPIEEVGLDCMVQSIDDFYGQIQ